MSYKEPKHLSRALSMIGLKVSDQQAALVIELADILAKKEGKTTLDDIEQATASVNARYKASQALTINK